MNVKLLATTPVVPEPTEEMVIVPAVPLFAPITASLPFVQSADADPVDQFEVVLVSHVPDPSVPVVTPGDHVKDEALDEKGASSRQPNPMRDVLRFVFMRVFWGLVYDQWG